ncbi:MAG: hypothetical protein JW738_08775 [Actinobacteria bacterium]|nr:hypothetical protein [Actinomycetota bacterium]
MSADNNKRDIWKFAVLVRRAISGKGHGPGEVAGERSNNKEQMIGRLSESLSTLPGPRRTGQLKTAALERAPLPVQETIGVAKSGRSAGRLFPVLAKAGMAVVLVLVLFIGMGFASVSAMPGNPLYSVKRVIESAKVSLASGGESTAEHLLDNAEERLDEIEYVKKREMKGWYYSLAEDAEADMERAYREAEHACGRSADKICSRAGKCHKRLKGLIDDSSEELSPSQEQQLDHRMQQFRNELDESPETAPGSPSQTEEPAGNEGSNCGCEQKGESSECPGQQSPATTCPSDSSLEQKPQGETQSSVPANKYGKNN